jgi:hypothetical protein
VRLGVTYSWVHAGEEGELQMVPAPPRVAPAGEPEGVVAGLAAAPHAALHLAALTVCTKPLIRQARSTRSLIELCGFFWCTRI